MTEPWQWALGFLGAFIVGLSKTGIAGLGILTVAIFATILPARESVGIVLVILIVADLVAVTVYRREADWKHLIRLFPWAGGGIILGALVFGRLNDEWVRIMIGGLLVVLTLFQIVRRRKQTSDEPVEAAAWVAPATGLTAGFTTMIANAAGPFMIIYLVAMRLPKMAFIGTTAWFFFAVNLFKVPFSYGLGLIDFSSLGLSLSFAPLAVVGAVSGRWLIRYINQQWFEAIALFLTLLAGFRLLLM